MDNLLLFLKLLADPTRFNIIGLLAIHSHSVDELAAYLNLSASTVSHHLTRLQKAGVVTAQAQQYYNIYTLHEDVFHRYAGQLTPAYLAQCVQMNEAVDIDAYTWQILAKWIKEERLQGLPSQIKHRQVVLGWLREKFELDRRYDEDQVWERLGEWCAPDILDYTPLYRALIDDGLFGRLSDGSWYWRTDSPIVQTAAPFKAELLPVAVTPNINKHTIRRAAMKARHPEGVYANLEAKLRTTTKEY